MIPKQLRNWSFRQFNWLIAVCTISLFFIVSHRYSRRPTPAQHVKSLRVKYLESKIPPPTAKNINRTLTKAPTTKQQNQLEQVHILPSSAKASRTQSIPSSNATTRHSKTRVIIIAYSNSGTPLLADILSKHPDVFHFQDPFQLFDTPRTDQQQPIARPQLAEAVAYLEQLLECNILESRLGYSDSTVKKISPVAFKECIRYPRDYLNVSECVQATCKSKSTVVATTTRVYVQDLKAILQKYAEAKVIVVQRDPRVTLHLKFRDRDVGWSAGSDMFFLGRDLCSRMLHDLQAARRFRSNLNRDFYRIVLFEHFLKDPEAVVTDLLQFLGAASELARVKDMLRRSNANRQVKRLLLNKWDSIPDDDVGMSIDKSCSFFYKASLYNAMRVAPGLVQRYNLCKYCD